MTANDHLATLRNEAMLSGCCHECGERLWERGGYLSDACRKCSPGSGHYVRQLPPRTLALACRWALDEIERFEAEVALTDDHEPVDVLPRGRNRQRFTLTPTQERT